MLLVLIKTPNILEPQALKCIHDDLDIKLLSNHKKLRRSHKAIDKVVLYSISEFNNFSLPLVIL